MKKVTKSSTKSSIPSSGISSENRKRKTKDGKGQITLKNYASSPNMTLTKETTDSVCKPCCWIIRCNISSGTSSPLAMACFLASITFLPVSRKNCTALTTFRWNGYWKTLNYKRVGKNRNKCHGFASEFARNFNQMFTHNRLQKLLDTNFKTAPPNHQ